MQATGVDARVARRRRMVWRLITQRPAITYRQIGAATGVYPSVVCRDVRWLIDAGYIRRFAPYAPGYVVLVGFVEGDIVPMFDSDRCPKCGGPGNLVMLDGVKHGKRAGWTSRHCGCDAIDWPFRKIGGMLRAARVARYMSREGLAATLKTTTRHINDVETGKIPPAPEIRRHWCGVVGVAVDEAAAAVMEGELEAVAAAVVDAQRQEAARP